MSVRQLLAHVRGIWKHKLMLKTNQGKGLICKAFGKYLLLTNIVSTGILMALGDVVQQEIEFQKECLVQRYDYNRVTRMCVVGLTFGPIQHYFYKYLNLYIPKRNMLSVIKKILADQLTMSPITIVLFFYEMGWLEGKSLDDITSEVQEKFIEVYLIDWIIWPHSQFINFYYVPVRYQVLYINIVAMIYFVFLSYIKHKDMEQRKK